MVAKHVAPNVALDSSLDKKQDPAIYFSPDNHNHSDSAPKEEPKVSYDTNDLVSGIIDNLSENKQETKDEKKVEKKVEKKEV